MSLRPIHFVVSAPRSGSTWLAQALNRHPDIFATEQRLFGEFCELWPNNDGKLVPRITFDAYARATAMHYFHQETSESRLKFVDEFVSAYIEFILEFARSKTGKQIVVDKITPYPGTSRLVLQRIKEYFPQAKIIRLTRDGRDVATSGVFDWLLKDGRGTPRYEYFVKSQSGSRLPRFFDDDVLSKWARHWREVTQSFGNDNIDLNISYEAMLDDQSVVLRKILQLIGANDCAETAIRCADGVTFEKQTGRMPGTLEPTAKQRSGTTGDWKKYFTRSDGELFASIAGEELCNLGYEPSNGQHEWVDELPDELTFSCQEVGKGGSAE